MPLAADNPVWMVISAPSGTGKTTLCQRLLNANPPLQRVITCTTRPPRPGERDGVDYFFLTEDAFQQRFHSGEFLEHALVYGYHYGSLKSDILRLLRQGHPVLHSVDVQGAASIRRAAQADPELARALFTVFLMPPSLDALEERLRNRGTDTPMVCQHGLSMALQEMSHWPCFDYLILSDTIPEDQRRAQIILDAERMRTSRQSAPPDLALPPAHAPPDVPSVAS